MAETRFPWASFCQISKAFKPEVRAVASKRDLSAVGTAGIHSQAETAGFFIRYPVNCRNSSGGTRSLPAYNRAKLSSWVSRMLSSVSAIASVWLAASCKKASWRSWVSRSYTIQATNMVRTNPTTTTNPGSTRRIYSEETAANRERRANSFEPIRRIEANASISRTGGSAALASSQFQARASISKPSKARISPSPLYAPEQIIRSSSPRT